MTSRTVDAMASPKLHLGIIPDGSRRWGRQHDKPPTWDGAESEAKVEEILTHISDKHPDIDEVSIWAMSTENLSRPDWDKSKVFRIVENLLTRSEVFSRAQAKVRFFGSRTAEFPASLRAAMKRISVMTSQYERLHVNVGLGYGGKDEIIQAVNRLARGHPKGNGNITPEEFESCLMLPRPLDMVVRTGGEQRLSGFMLYQVEYAELFFTPTLWPAFSPDEFDAMIANYRARDRRFGK